MPGPAAIPAAIAALGPIIAGAGRALVPFLPQIAGKIGSVVGKAIKPGTSKLASDIQFSAPSGEGLQQDPTANLTSGLLDKDFSARTAQLARVGTQAAQTVVGARRDLRRARSGDSVRRALQISGEKMQRRRERLRGKRVPLGATPRR